MYQSLITKEKKLAVIGLGYVGLPIALEFAKKIRALHLQKKLQKKNLVRKTDAIVLDINQIIKVMPHRYPFLLVDRITHIDKEENPLYFMENKWPDKFDFVIANPPYSGKDTKFLERACNLAKKQIVFVHPQLMYI